jgi:predicted RNA-binding protein YlxR (DUF448 family)
MSSRPIRTCLGCGRKGLKKYLLRLVLRGEQVVIDKESKLNGRGVYCCDIIDCRSIISKNKKKLAAAFRAEVNIERVDLR